VRAAAVAVSAAERAAEVVEVSAAERAAEMSAAERAAEVVAVVVVVAEDDGMDVAVSEDATVTFVLSVAEDASRAVGSCGPLLERPRERPVFVLTFVSLFDELIFSGSSAV